MKGVISSKSGVEEPASTARPLWQPAKNQHKIEPPRPKQEKPQRLKTRPPTDTSEERRISDRCDLNETVQWSLGNLRHSSQVLDISEGGMRLSRGVQAVPLFQKIKIFIPLPSTERGHKKMCFVEGVIVWKNKRELGVSFLPPPKDVVTKLRSYIAKTTLKKSRQ